MRNYPAAHRNPRRLRYGLRLTASGHIVVDARQRAIIYRILELRRQDHTLQEICHALHAENLPAPRNAAWYCSTVKKIIEQNVALNTLLTRLCDRTAAPITKTRPDAHEHAARSLRASRRGSAEMHHADDEAQHA